LPADAKYTPSLNFYRRVYGEEGLVAFVGTNPADSYPQDKRAYVFDIVDGQKLIEGEHLQVVYRGARSGIIVALRPSEIKPR
jgi:hypothetical protein